VKIPKLDVEYSTRLCFACGPDNPIGLKLKPVHDGEKVWAEFTPRQYHQGWDNAVHGVILYTLLDEVTAYAILCRGIYFGVTARSNVRFRQVAPINEPIRISAWVTKLTKRLVETEGVLRLKDDTVIAEGNSLFYVLSRSRRTILWDMDGVIADSASFHFAAWQEVFRRRGIGFTKDDFTRLFGTRNDFIIRTITGKDIREEGVRLILEEKEKLFREKARGKLKPFPGVMKLLNSIRQGNFRSAITSSAPTDNIDFTCDELNIRPYFMSIVSGKEVPASKPSPQIFLLAAQKLGAEPRDCVVIEDSPLGVEAAKAAGMRCLAVTNTHPSKELEKADKVVNSLDEVDLITLVMRV
jgi:HAD superfamily hydrolase (TIGR01509 family)